MTQIYLPDITNILEKTRDLFKDPDRWTKNAVARNKKGEEVRLKEGYSFCIMGGIFYIEGATPRADNAFVHVNRVAHNNYNMNAVDVNNKLGYNSVMELLDKAIETPISEGD